MIGRAFEKIVEFFLLMFFNGLVALFVAFFAYLIFSVTATLASLPIAVIFGEGVADKILQFLDRDIVYTIFYALAFFSMMLDDLGVPNFKTWFKKMTNKKVSSRTKE